MKFTPKVKPITSGDNSNKSKLVLVSIERILFPIFTKSQKKVNQISKYFKNLKPTPVVRPTHKSYAQASKQASYTVEVIKIKDTFLTLGAKKIDQIQNIVKDGLKPKLQIQMTTKEPSRKQVIILINSDNTVKFIKESS